jgi:predicted O-methyltransferase YrrM
MFRIINFVKYFLRAKTAHGVHSPFAFNFVQNVLKNKQNYYAFEDIESIRAKLLLSNLEVQVTDLGAGSKKIKNSKRKISEIVRYSAKSKKYGQLLFKIVSEYKCKNMLELGTSLGISTMYLASVSKQNNIVTIEGCSNISKVAEINFSKLNFKNICSIVGNFDNVLPNILKKNKFDLVFIDGNHKGEALLKYTEMCLPHLTENAILIADDINWSKDMNDAWKKITAKNEIMLSIDLFEMGICFTNKTLSKEHFILRF